VPRVNTKEAHLFISELQPFSSNGALTGDFDKVGDYVVKSYTTPIFVFQTEERKAFLNCERYSVTTSRHQGQVRQAIAKMDNITALEYLHEKEEFERLTGYHIRQGRLS